MTAFISTNSDWAANPLAAVIIANRGQVEEDLAAGALVVIGETRVRTRGLPFKGSA
jgi:hypothetical protein